MFLTLLKLAVKTGLRFFYRRHQVVGQEHIPKQGGVIFAANHQNSLMDALNVICNIDRHPYYATRADVFKKEWHRRMLLSLKMYPVFRPKDGRASMANNEDSFNFFAGKLMEGDSAAIFPAGAPAYTHKLLPFKKGLARLALRTVALAPDKPIYIQPTGLQYSDLFQFHADLLVQFGPPILVNDYADLYAEHPAKALRQLTIEVRKRIGELIHDIPTEDYNFINFSRKYLRAELLLKQPNIKQKALFDAERKHMNRLLELKQNAPAEYEKTKQASLALLTEIEERGEGLTAYIRRKSGKSQLLSYLKLFFLFPLLLLGAIVHFPLARWIKSKAESAKDRQFYTTFKFLYGWILYPILYFFMSIFLVVLTGFWWTFFLAFLLPFLGKLTFLVNDR